MKEERGVIIKHIEKEFIYVQNLVDVLAKKYGAYCLKNETDSQK